MYRLLVAAIISAAISDLGLSFSDIRGCLLGRPKKIELASRKILKIDWKPISVFPEEAHRFR
ncbi:MAG: hypothetical protein AB7F86_07260 [Bdellovibrionales bacterium]